MMESLASFLQTELWVQLEFLLRIVVAGVCGLFIGLERKNRLKNAGLKTHLLIAVTSALMVIISKYGFSDVLSMGLSVDASRVAASVASGIGFLGAGLILAGKHEVIGVTTAAGVWATVGIGMALGAGMYFLGIASTILILVSQTILHKRL
ncbi:MgtC/SapB family protein, partial [uncultured Negativibacillus sp.]|uniref:MgtC/SapB family protein n=1 Tax=uncultured Negativibacillus sp. TaxID=1980696 RepID=UPI0025CEDDFE